MQKNISFLDMIERYSICIPKIQRDYAQGREDDKTTEIRESFLEEMIEALEVEDNIPLVLDFVYGSTDEHSVFTPLDGQQRLTTLFLLHWYLLPTDESGLLKGKMGIPRFSYETRISSKDFCKSLVATSPQNIKDNAAKAMPESTDGSTKKEWTLSESIQNEPWFLWSWRKDPTIKGMLVMLDAIDKKLKAIPDKISLWDSLTKDRKIVFHILPLERFNLTEELYVKMNARGKELSAFDILKSTFEEQIKKNQVTDSLQEEWRTDIDSKWMDLFWNKKAIAYLNSPESDKKKEIVNTVEASYLRFLKRMMYFHLFMIDDFENPGALNKDKFTEGIKSVRTYVRDHDIITIIQQLSKCGFFNEAFFSFVVETMQQLLYKKDTHIKEGSEFVTVPFWAIDNREVNNLFEMFIDDKITYLGRILFFAQIQFFKYRKAETLQESVGLRKELNNWMRVIRNLSYNTSYNNVDEFRNTIKALETLAAAVYAESDTSSVLGYFANDGEVRRFDSDQVTEEREKARQILHDIQWENKIVEAECYAFWQGCIRFLFTDKENVYNWNLFVSRFENAQKYFDANGVAEEYRKNARLICMFISLFTKWEQCWEVRIGNGIEAWNSNLRNKNLVQPLSDLLDSDIIPEEIINYSSKIPDGEKEYVYMTHEDMCYNGLIHEAINVMGEGILLNERYDQYVLYRPKTNAEWKKYTIGNKRNKILFDLRERGIITTGQNISGMPYFWGYDIEFNTHTERYRVDRNNNFQIYNDEIDEWENEGITLDEWTAFL